MTDRDAPIILVEDHGYPLISVPAPQVRNRHEIATAAIISLGFLLGFTMGYLVASAAPRPASAPSIPVAAQARTGAPPGLPHASLSSAARAIGEAAGRTAAPTGYQFARSPGMVGTASWYRADGLIAAAGPGLRHGQWRGSHVIVSANGRSVTVELADWCACPHGRLIDLGDDAFARLAPLSRGLVRVTIAGVGPAPTLPPTDGETP